MANEKDTKVEEAANTSQDTIGKAESFIEKNKKAISAFVIGAVVGVGGWFAYKNFVAAPKEKAAQEEVFQAQFYFEKDSFNLALNGDAAGNKGFLAIIDEYSGTPIGNTSKFYAGVCYMNLGKFDDAIAVLEDYKGDDTFTPAQSLGLIGDAYAEKNDLEKALEYYIKAAEKNDNPFTAPMFLNKAAGIYEDQKKYKEALETYTKIRDKYYVARNGQEGQEAERNMARVKALGNL